MKEERRVRSCPYHPERRAAVPENLEKKIQRAINSVSAENASNTPDWILAQFLTSVLAVFDTAVQQRETWYGRDARPTAIKEFPGEAVERARLAPSPLGGLGNILAEYDRITDRLDSRDAEADFVMRGSDWRQIRAALNPKNEEGK